MAETITDEDVAMLREAQERLRQRALVEPVGGAPRALCVAFGPSNGEPAVPAVQRCQGGCGEPVARRGGWCPPCGEQWRRRAREIDVSPARETFSPGGALDWCRAGDPRYAAATAKALANVPREMARLVTHAAWKRETGSMLILGPTDYGKTRILAAIGHRVLDYAVKVGWSQPEITRFARGVRYVSALDIGRARSQSKFEEPEIVRTAKGATLLLLDEVGYEEDRFDPHALRDILRSRFDPTWKPTIVASGKTWAELSDRYGEPTLRTLTCKGVLMDLHPRKAA